MGIIGKKSYISYVQPVHLSTEEPFAELQNMRLQEALLYAECMMKQLTLGEIVKMVWQLQTKKGEVYTFSFQIGQLEETLPLMKLMEEGVRQSLSPEDAEKVLNILPLQYEAKEKEYEAPRQWVLENEENFYFMESEQAYVDDSTPNTMEYANVEVLPEMPHTETWVQEPEIALQDEIEELEGIPDDTTLEEINEVEEIVPIPEEIEIMASVAVPSQEKSSIQVNADALYQKLPSVDEKLQAIFSVYTADKAAANVFERHQKMAEKKEVQKSIDRIKKEIAQKEVQLEQEFWQEKSQLEQQEQEKQKQEEEQQAQQLQSLEETYAEKIEQKKESIQYEKNQEKEQALAIEEQKYQQCVLELEKKYASEVHDLANKATEKLEQELQDEKKKIISHNAYEWKQENQAAMHSIPVLLKHKNNERHSELQGYIYALAEEEKARIEEVMKEIKPTLDEAAKQELEEMKLRMEVESDEKYLNMERDMRMKQLEQEKEIEDRKQRAQEKQSADQMKHEVYRSKEEYTNAIQLMEQMMKMFPHPTGAERVTIPDEKERKSSVLKTAMISFAAIVCACIIGLGIMFGLKYAPVEQAATAETTPSQTASQAPSVDTPSLDALLNQKDFLKAAQLYPDNRDQIEEAIFDLKDVGALKRFNAVYTTMFGQLDAAILAADYPTILEVYEKHPNGSYRQAQLESIGEAYVAQDNIEKAQEIQKMIQSDTLQAKIDTK
ncbi:hypothetical protein [Listeria booriae]|uniref:hypothetical protein n=1 Tax=Listeria booriae TaxID=1552123 RepID=UPI001629C939|nr:hypothetical protein [Listeria booriae]MBC2164836.1 hypothetical protein [Listeria booriae]